MTFRGMLVIVGVLVILTVTGCSQYEGRTGNPNNTTSVQPMHIVDRNDDYLANPEYEEVKRIIDTSGLDATIENVARLGDEFCAAAIGSYTWLGFDMAMDQLTDNNLDIKSLGYGAATFMCYDRIHDLDGHPATTVELETK